MIASKTPSPPPPPPPSPPPPSPHPPPPPGTVTSVTSNHTLSTHEISCCGVGLSPDSALVAVGDLAGNVYLYSCEEGGPVWPLEMWNVRG